MKILVLSPVFPYPPADGDRLRIFNFIKSMGKKNEIYLISFIKKEEEIFVEKFKKYCKKIHFVYISKKEIILKALVALLTLKPINVFSYYKKDMQFLINNFLNKNSVDIIFTYRIRMAPYVENIKNPKIVDFVDSLAFYMKEKLKYEKNLITLFYLMIDSKRVFNYEKNLLKSFNCGLINYEGDKEYLNEKNIYVLANGVDFDGKTTKIKKEKKIIKIGFLGDMNYSPNKDGIYFFYKNVWKKLNKFDKKIRLIIAGKGSEKLKIKDDKTIKCGYIKNIDSEIKSWDLCIVPVRYGAGRQNKILKAWLNKVPVIATRFAAKGVYGRDYYNLLLADLPEEFIQKINKLLKDKKLKNRLIKNGYKTLKKYFDWNKTGKILNNLLRRIK